MAVADWVDGRWPSNKELPCELKEFLIVKETGWTLTYIRTLDMRDLERLTLMSDVYRIKMENKRVKLMQAQFGA